MKKANDKTQAPYGKVETVKEHVKGIIEGAMPGDRITPELKLAKNLQVSHSTVRRALDDLVDEGLLCRKHGSGTFVNYKRPIVPGKPDSQLPLESFFRTRSNTTLNHPKLELTFATYEAPREIALYQQSIEQFEGTTSGIHIALQPRRIQRMLPDYFYDIEEGRPPNLFYLNQSHLFWLIRNGYIQPLDDHIGDTRALDNLDPFVKHAITYHDHTWVMPKNLNIFYMLYNKKIFDAKGVPYPDSYWTWDDYLAASIELTFTDETGKQFYGTEPYRDYLYLTIIAWAFGGELVDESGKVKIDSDATREAIKFAVDITLRHKATPLPDDWNYWSSPTSKHKDATQKADYFKQGRLAMLIKTGTDLNDYISDPDIDFGVAPIPAGPCGRAIPVIYSGWAMSAATPSPATCGAFLRHLGIDHNAPFARNNLSPFITQDNLQSYFTPDKPGNGFNIMVMKNYLREYSFHGHYWPYLMGHIDEMFKNIFMKRASINKEISECSAAMQADMDKFLKWLEE